MLIANATQIRDADQIQIHDMEYPGIILMEQAGKLAAEKLLELYPQQVDFIVLAGPGNNGGDGLVIARYLHLKGKHVQVYFSHDADRFQGDAEIQFRIMRHLPIAWGIWEAQHSERILDDSHPPVVIDALLGTGIDAQLRDPIASMISYWRQKSFPIVAVDLPSGLNANTGQMINSVLQADHTLTFQLPKICHYITPAASECGSIHVLDIGIWPSVIHRLGISRSLLDEEFVRNHYRKRELDGHKGTYGHVLVIGGSAYMSGAIAMTGYSALKAGAGLVSILCPHLCREAVYALVPEAMCRSVGSSDTTHVTLEHVEITKELLKGKSAVIIGPGMGTHPETLSFLEHILPDIDIPVILDADAINLLSQTEAFETYLTPQTILTPHPGELRRLIEEPVSEKRLEFTESFVQDNPCILLLKGAGTIVALPDGKTYINTSGNPGMATGGSGDILSGILGALISQGYEPDIAVPLGVYLHGKAGDAIANEQGMEGLVATDIARVFSKVWKEIVES